MSKADRRNTEKFYMNISASANSMTVSTSSKDGDAVGVPVRQWFIGIVGNNTEKQCAERLRKRGFEAYVPTQSEERHWRTGVNNVVERIVFPSLVFVRATESERRGTVVNLPYVKRFMTDKASRTDAFGKHPVATIPNEQIEALKFMLGNAESEVTIHEPPLKLGDRVRVLRGGLVGLEGYVEKIVEGKARIYILVDCLGCASVEVEKISLEIIK